MKRFRITVWFEGQKYMTFVFRSESMWGAMRMFRETHSWSAWWRLVREMKVEFLNEEIGTEIPDEMKAL